MATAKKQDLVLTGRDLFVRVTSPNGKSHIQQHRVWDGMRFIESLQEQYRKAKDPADRCTVALATEQEYKAARAAA